jgi:ribose transport system substrate-binding protein
MKIRNHLKSAVAIAATAGTLLAVAATPGRAEDHYKVFLDMSYSGNSWQASAANGIKALAGTPPYDKSVEFKTVISGTDVQHQISDLQSMIAAGAKAIIMYPLSPTALNRVIKQACAKNILVFAYDSTVTEPCAYNDRHQGLRRAGARRVQALSRHQDRRRFLRQLERQHLAGGGR